MSIERLASSFYISTTGIAGTPAQVSSTYIALFVIFAGFLEASGAGKFFIDWSYAALAWFRGGPAKVAIIGSSLMGAINGSAVANTVATGTFTIPMMKRAGMRPEFAAAVEASASSGGQLVPPVMGAAAFMMVDFTVAAQGVRGVPRSELPSAIRIFLKGWYLIIPLLVLVWMLVFLQYSPIKSAFYATISVFFLSFFTPNNKMGPSRLVEALRSGGLGTLEVAAACACAGAAIAKANSTVAGVMAFRLTLAGFILPFIWVYDPSLILQGTYLETAQVVILTLIALSALASAITGYLFGVRAAGYQRGLLFAGAILIIDPGFATNLIGVGLVALVAATRWMFGGRRNGVIRTDI